MKRYELSTRQWERIAPSPPGKVGYPGRSGADDTTYKLRDRVKRCFKKLNHFRRFATRNDRRADHFLAFIHLAAIMLRLR